MNETMTEQLGCASEMRCTGDTPLDFTPNWDHARKFLDALDSGGTFTFQAFPEAEGSHTRPKVLHGTLEKHGAELEALNRAGSGNFVMVNAGDGVILAGARTCRTTANVIRVRALFVDLDGAPVAPVLRCALPPDWVVQSSLRRWHAYWKVTDCQLDEFASLQSDLAQTFNGDRTVKDLPRVMRVPGFYHRKAEPFRSELYLPDDYRRLLEIPE